MQAFMCIYGLILYFETPRKARQGRALYLLASFVLCSLGLISAVCNNWTAYHIVSAVGFNLEDLSPAVPFYSSTSTIVAAASFWFSVLIGDALLIYRTYIIWNYKVIVFPCLAYLAMLALMIRTFIPVELLLNLANAPYLMTITCLKLGSNIYITAAISLRLIRMRKALKSTILSSDTKVYLGVVAILIESAAPVVLFGIIYACTVPLRGDVPYKVYGVAALAYNFFVEMAPQWIIFRVATGRSWVKAPGWKAGESVVTHSLHFAAPESATQTTTEV
ncbi:hypothetical protein FA15DRAFT_641244 [Coprinopsis marcescibilis]|uniref:Uncharacterized protein n=1 Tax=Coprinopsis marcescibilis TaxID=230819 RepID=A0A5C3KVW2_COPMA|nr:hypothetical protein FA15DRAFT_641244 [Coprinopsis marcescibilis]